MPDIPNRDELERQLARLLGRVNGKVKRELIAHLGQPPRIENVPAEFWVMHNDELARAYQPFAERQYIAAAQRLVEASPIGIEWGLVNEGAANWAERYTFELVGGIERTSRQALQSAVSGFYRDQQTLGQLNERLGNIWGPVRAELIASTELTRSAVQGELAFVEEIRKEGIEMVAVWQTNADEIVCPICSPLNQKKQGDGWQDPPPAHPRCRCWLNHEIAPQQEGELEFAEKPEQTLVPRFESVQDAEEWARKNGLAEHVDYFGVTPEGANIINEELFNQYGNNSPIRRLLTGAGQDEAGLNIMLHVTDDLDFIVYNIAKDPQVIKQLLAENEAAFAARFGSNQTAFLARDFRELVVHELGHATDFSYAKDQRLKRFWYAERIGADQGVSFAQLNQGALTQAAKQEASIISDYATQSAYEYFAESWLAAKTGREDLLPPHVLEILREAGL